MYLKNLLKVSCFILLCSFVIPAMAQNKIVTGKVTDSKDGSTLIGASVVAKGSTVGAITDVNGDFRLSMPMNANTLVVSYIGYTSKEVAITSSTVNVTLDANNNSLNEVLVVGYGTVRKRDATGAVVKVSSGDFVQGVTTDPLQQLQGKAAGVVISSVSGDPNHPLVVRVRGTASLSGGNDPLYVIDGVAGADIRAVSPNDIESFDILKDASAAAIYGSRAAGGVILVTTKTGKAGKSQVSYNTYVASESAEHLAQFMNRAQYLAAYQAANNGASMPTGTSTTSDQGANTNWFKQIVRTGFTQNQNLSLSGGTEKSHYRGSLTYITQQGIAINSKRNDLNGRFNFDQKTLDDKLTITMNLSIDHINANYTDSIAFLDAAAVPPVLSVFDPLGSGQYQYINNTQENNPVPYLKFITNTGAVDQYLGNLRLDYQLAKGLTISPYANATRKNATTNIYIPASTLLGAVFNRIYNTKNASGSNITDQGNSDADDGSATETVETAGFTVAYKNTFGKSRLSLLGGYEYNEFTYTGFHISAHDFDGVILPGENIGSANTVSPGSDLSSYDNGYKLNSWLGRAEYNYNDRYYFTGNLRYDWSNKLGINSQSQVFPSGSIAWAISNEDFMKDVQWITSLKLRGGYGQVGNQDAISPLASQLLFGSNGLLYYDGTTGKYLPANFSIQNQNNGLRWEVKTTTDAGIDFSLFGGRLNGAFDFYSSTTNHLLFNYPVATGGTFFVGNILANVGSLTNKGVDFSLDGTVIKGSGFTWRASANISLNRNKITDLAGTLPGGLQTNTQFAQVGTTSGLGVSGAVTQIGYLAVGYPVGTLLLPQYAGKDASGNQLFYHYNADGSRTAVLAAGLNIGSPGADDRRFYTTDPKFNYGFTNNFSYAHFDLTVFMRGEYGSHAFNEVGMDYSTIAGKVGTYAVLASATAAGINSNPEPSTYWLQGTSFLKIQNATLGYNFTIKDNRYIDRLHVYIAGNNLYTFTKYKGVDPEISDNVVGGEAGIDTRTSLYPRTRELSFGVNLTLK